MIGELLARGYLVKSYNDGYPLLKLAGNSSAVLKGTEKVMFPVDKERSPGWASLQGTKLPCEAGLLDTLTEMRSAFAEKENLAPYIILSDATLSELAMYLPQNRLELERISGFGEMKIDKYGDAFLSEINAYCLKHNLRSNIDLKAEKRKQGAKSDRETHTMQQTLTLFMQGNTIEQIAAIRKLGVSTIEKHLAFYIQQGKINVEALVNPGRLPVIRAAIKQSGGKMLTPVKQILGEAYSYTEIKYVMAATAAKAEDVVCQQWQKRTPRQRARVLTSLTPARA